VANSVKKKLILAHASWYSQAAKDILAAAPEVGQPSNMPADEVGKAHAATASTTYTRGSGESAKRDRARLQLGQKKTIVTLVEKEGLSRTWNQPTASTYPRTRTTTLGGALAEKERAVIGAEAGERTSVGMASSGASAESAGARGKRQVGRGGDGRSRRRRGGRRGPGRRSRGRNARMSTTETGASARPAGAPPSASTTDRGAQASPAGRVLLRTQPNTHQPPLLAGMLSPCAKCSVQLCMYLCISS
jgi:hypothetical protein